MFNSATPGTAACQALLFPGVCSNSCPFSQWCHPIISSSATPFSSCPLFPSIRVFTNESALRIRWPEYWSFSFSNSPSNEYSQSISFRNDWFGLLALQGTLKNILQHHNSKASILQYSAFFMVQLLHHYMTTGKKNMVLTVWTFVGKVMSLLFNMLSGVVIAFLVRNKRLFMSWLQSTVCSDFGAQENKVCHCFCFFLPWSDGARSLWWLMVNVSCRILDLKRRFSFGTRDQAWSLKSFCVAEFC